ncbi:MAG: ribosome silencing factor [Chlamydiia bacterium]|nr:ribosome silencing factor [Chlamydiia bacterium]
MVKDPSNVVQEIAQTIYDKKGTNIIAIDVRGISSITDYVIIADGNVDRHVIALSNEVQNWMRNIGEKPVHIEGQQAGDWVVIDYFQIVIHLLLPEMRQKYQLERLWPDGKVIDLDLKLDLKNVKVSNE